MNVLTFYKVGFPYRSAVSGQNGANITIRLPGDLELKVLSGQLLDGDEETGA